MLEGVSLVGRDVYPCPPRDRKDDDPVLAPSQRDDLERKEDDSQINSVYQHIGVELI